MFNLFTCFVLLLAILSAFGQFQIEFCTECKNIKQCPAAMKLLLNRSPAIEEGLRAALCGYEGQTPKVCCPQLAKTHLLGLLPQECGRYDFKKSTDSSTGLWDFPWMSLLVYKHQDGRVTNHCAGTIINSRYILTVAHCVLLSYYDNSPKLIGVRVGEYDVRTVTDCVGDNCASNVQDIEIEKVIAHEGYKNSPTIMNDIALLRLAKDINLTQINTKPICLPITQAQKSLVLVNMTAKIAGWGNTDSGAQSPALLSADIPVLDGRECIEPYNKLGRKEDMVNKICAGREVNSCAGDSGGPLMIKSHDHHDRLIQYGIVSYGVKKCGAPVPAVYTDVTKYVDWILEKIEP